MKMHGFTLAEVLISLGIISVVSAITMPAMTANYQKNSTVVQLKNAYSLITQAVGLSEVQNGQMSEWSYLSGEGKSIEFFDEYLLPFLKCTKSDEIPKQLTYYGIDGNKETGLAILRGGKAAVYNMVSGTQIIVGDGTITSSKSPVSDTSSSVSFIVDLNGYKAKPNKFGKDTFYIVVNFKKGVYLAHFDDGEAYHTKKTREELKDGPSAERYQCNKSGRGVWCGALIQADGWQISPDYPW